MSYFPYHLAYCEDSLPGRSRTEKLDLAKNHGLALEIANRGNFPIELYDQAQITAVQAYRMHDFHPLHCNAEKRSQALPHVIETLEIAARLEAPRIVTVCGFGNDLADQPMERCLDFFGSCARRAKELSIRLMIEPLSPKRCVAMTNPHDISRLIASLNEPEVFSLMLDTGHLLDSGIELDSFFQNWNEPIEELQLKGSKSTPPKSEMPVQMWLEALPVPPAVISVEHRQAIAPHTFTALIHSLQHSLN